MPRLCSSIFSVLGIVLCLLPVSLAAQQAADAFTIVALPDTQFYSANYPQIFAAQTNWIAQHASSENIRLVAGLGDIVDSGGNLAQWNNADAAVRALDGVVPYMMAIGNHDYDRSNPSGRTAATHNFNSFFGPQRYAAAAWYRGNFPTGSNENFYGVISAGGKEYLILVLEFAPRDASLRWAAGIISANKDKDVIIVTHMFTFVDNTRISQCDSNSAASFGVGQDNNGEDMWWKLVRKYPNIHLVLSGHVVQGDGTGRRMDLGMGGNLVNQILSDYQSEPLGGGGFLRILKISPSLNRISVTTYSPYLDQFKTDDHNQFTVPYRNPGTASAPGTVSGKVKNAIDCSPMAGVTVTNAAGTAVTDANGNFSFPAPARKSYAITATKPGWLSNALTATATLDAAAEPSPTKIFVATAGRVRGTVTDSAGAPVANARVTLTGGKLRQSVTVQTSASGVYNSNWISVGGYTVTVWASGFSLQQLQTTVNAGATTTLNEVLQ